MTTAPVVTGRRADRQSSYEASHLASGRPREDLWRNNARRAFNKVTPSLADVLRLLENCVGSLSVGRSVGRSVGTSTIIATEQQRRGGRLNIAAALPDERIACFPSTPKNTVKEFSFPEEQEEQGTNRMKKKTTTGRIYDSSEARCC